MITIFISQIKLPMWKSKILTLKSLLSNLKFQRNQSSGQNSYQIYKLILNISRMKCLALYKSEELYCNVYRYIMIPVAVGLGTKETWTLQKLSLPALNWNWRNASMKGIPSISPMVPPSSIIQTSGTFWSSETGTLATLSTHSWSKNLN